MKGIKVAPPPKNCKLIQNLSFLIIIDYRSIASIIVSRVQKLISEPVSDKLWSDK